MVFRDTSYLEPRNPFCSAERNHFICAVLVEDIKRNSSVIFFEFGLVVQEEMLFKDISYLELWRPFCSAERMICAIFV